MPKVENETMKKCVWKICKNDIPQVPSELTEEWWKSKFDLTKVRWMVFQYELGGKKNRYHIHCVMSFYSQKRFSTLRKELGPGKIRWLHTQDKEGKEEFQNSLIYCQKEETRVAGPFYHGEVPRFQGDRTDLKLIHKEIVKGNSLGKIAKNPEMFPTLCKYIRGIKEVKSLLDWENRKELKDIKVKSYCYWGKSGTGKTENAKINANGEYYRPIIQNGSIWFNKYNNEKKILFDDFKGGCPLHLLLQIMDGNPMLLSDKGSDVSNFWEEIYFTSNTHPAYWYMGCSAEERKALVSRFTEIVEFTSEINLRDTEIAREWLWDGKEMIQKPEHVDFQE